MSVTVTFSLHSTDPQQLSKYFPCMVRDNVSLLTTTAFPESQLLRLPANVQPQSPTSSSSATMITLHTPFPTSSHPIFLRPTSPLLSPQGAPTAPAPTLLSPVTPTLVTLSAVPNQATAPWRFRTATPTPAPGPTTNLTAKAKWCMPARGIPMSADSRKGRDSGRGR